MYAIAGTADLYNPLPVRSDGFFLTMRAYALLNGIPMATEPDLSQNELYGTRLDRQRWIELGDTRALVGTLSNEKGVMMKLVGLDPYAHWNYKPAVPDIWSFLSDYRRDLKAGKLIVVKNRTKHGR